MIRRCLRRLHLALFVSARHHLNFLPFRPFSSSFHSTFWFDKSAVNRAATYLTVLAKVGGMESNRESVETHCDAIRRGTSRPNSRVQQRKPKVGHLADPSLVLKTLMTVSPGEKDFIESRYRCILVYRSPKTLIRTIGGS